MQEYISPNNENLFGKTDSETIQNAIAEAEKDGCRQVLIPRYNARVGKCEWRISESIKMPSNFTVILDNCYMVQETGAYDNLFTNLYSWDLDKCTKMEYEQENIAIIGRGNVILDGGVHNHLLEKTVRKFRQPSLRRNNMFLWINVNGLKMENLHIENQRHWAINHIFCRNVKIKDIDFYAIPHVNNMDGIDLRIGCNNFDIQNITGRTGDDVIAMTALHVVSELENKVDGKDLDIHDVKIRNVKADPSHCFLVRVLNHDGSNIYNVDIDTIMDVSDYTKKVASGACIHVGDLLYAQVRPVKLGETRNITAKNMTSRGRNAVSFGGPLAHSTFSNIKTYGDNHSYYTHHGVGNTFPCSFNDVTFEHFWYGAEQHGLFSKKQIDTKNYRGTVINFFQTSGDITFRDINVDRAKCGIHADGNAKFTVNGFKYNSIDIKIDVTPEITLIYNEEEQ